MKTKINSIFGELLFEFEKTALRYANLMEVNLEEANLEVKDVEEINSKNQNNEDSKS